MSAGNSMSERILAWGRRQPLRCLPPKAVLSVPTESETLCWAMYPSPRALMLTPWLSLLFQGFVITRQPTDDEIDEQRITRGCTMVAPTTESEPQT